MADIKSKPSGLWEIWAEIGQIVKPTVEKIRRGWTPEIPPHEWFNWFQNQVTRALAHFNQRGIAEWDRETEYLARKSYVQGSNGIVYRARLDGAGNDPVTDRVHWEVAFTSGNDPESRKDFIGWIALSGDISAQPNYKYYFTSFATCTLPQSALRGDSVEVASTPNVDVDVVVAGGASIYTRLGQFDLVEVNIPDGVVFVYDGEKWEVN